MGDYSSILFAEPSFLEGMARVLDIGGTLNEYNRSPTGAMADQLAMWSDWSAVGDSINKAMNAESAKANVQAFKKT